MTEGQLVDAIVELAQAAGFKVCHFRPARTNQGWRTAIQGDKGFPDLVIARPGRIIFAECKASGKLMDLDQADWLNTLMSHCTEIYVWRPEDWHSGAIAKILGCGMSMIRRRDEEVPRKR